MIDSSTSALYGGRYKVDVGGTPSQRNIEHATPIKTSTCFAVSQKSITLLHGKVPPWAVSKTTSLILPKSKIDAPYEL